MAMPAWMPEAWAELNANEQKQISDFMQFLLSQNREKKLQPLNYGVFKGKIKLPPNFDDPLPEFSEYM